MGDLLDMQAYRARRLHMQSAASLYTNVVSMLESFALLRAAGDQMTLDATVIANSLAIADRYWEEHRLPALSERNRCYDMLEACGFSGERVLNRP